MPSLQHYPDTPDATDGVSNKDSRKVTLTRYTRWYPPALASCGRFHTDGVFPK